MNIKRILLSAVLSAGVMLSSAGCSLFGGGSGASSGNIGDITFADGDKIAVIEFKDYGTVRAKLFPDIAPIGVENFIKLAEQGYYNGLKIHRVIHDTYIQGGSLNGDGTGGTAAYCGEDAADNATTFPIEVSENARNFYGALGYAADAYGNNSVQFYIVSNKTPTDTSKISAEKVQAKADELASKIAEESAPASTAEGSTAEGSTAESETTSSVNSDSKALAYQQSYYSNNASFIKKNGAQAAEKYNKVGGLYQIDGGYTVFGQIYEGFDVIDKINDVAVTTNASGEKSMPIQDVVISSVTIETYTVSTAESSEEASGNNGSKQTTAASATTSASSASAAEPTTQVTADAASTEQASSTAESTAQTAEAQTTSENQTTAEVQSTAESDLTTADASDSSQTAEISTVDTTVDTNEAA